MCVSLFAGQLLQKEKPNMTVKPASAPVLEAAPPPVVAQPQPTVIVVQSRAGHPPAGVPEGGMWIEEKYCGSATWIIGLLIVPCVFLCPLDTRTVSSSVLHIVVVSENNILTINSSQHFRVVSADKSNSSTS